MKFKGKTRPIVSREQSAQVEANRVQRGKVHSHTEPTRGRETEKRRPTNASQRDEQAKDRDRMPAERFAQD